MRIQLKVNLISLAIMTAVVCSVGVAGVIILDRLTLDLNRKLLSFEADTVLQRIRETYDVLRVSGVEQVSDYVQAAQRELVQKLGGDQKRLFGRLTIVEESGAAVLVPHEVSVATLPHTLLATMIDTGSGNLEYVGDGGGRFLFYRDFKPWRWLVIISVSTDEMYAMRKEFIRSTAVILIVGLVLGGGAVLLFMRGVVGPVRQLAEAALAISQARWSHKLPTPAGRDEVGELAEAFTIMTNRLQEAQTDLRRQAGELLEANAALTQEVGERRRAERELHFLNQDLERLVGERTADLAAKASELKKANETLLEMDELKSAFVSSVSHELRTPLTSVLGFVKLIKRDFFKYYRPLSHGNGECEHCEQRILQNFEIIMHEGDRLTRLINDFLDLTRIESGKLDWADQDVDTSWLLRRSVEGIGGIVLNKPGVELVVEIPDDLPRLHVDPDRIEQVVINLIINAIKFTDNGRVIVSASSRPGCFCFQVMDTGRGIPPDDLDKVFDKFHQVRSQNTPEDKTPGTGLGLAICEQIVSHYSGSISVSSELGKGSTFTVELPVPGTP